MGEGETPIEREYQTDECKIDEKEESGGKSNFRKLVKERITKTEGVETLINGELNKVWRGKLDVEKSNETREERGCQEREMEEENKD